MWKFKLSRCVVYYEHELLYVCINSAVSKLFPIKIEFVDHEKKVRIHYVCEEEEKQITLSI